MKNLKAIALLALSMTLFFSCQQEEQVNPDESSINLVEQIGSTNKRQYNPPWVFVMDARFSRETCQTGPGVCFQNSDGDILNIGTGANIGDVFYTGSNNPDSDTGVIGIKLDNDRLRMVFSQSLEEETLIIDDDVILDKKVAIALGLESIMIPKGSYELNFENFEHGEAIIPAVLEGIQLDQDSDYGTINRMDFPVNRGHELNDFLEYLNLSQDQISDYSISESNFSGKANAEHLIDGQIVNVWHEYEEEDITIFEATLNDGTSVLSLQINACRNMAQWEADLIAHLLKNKSWYYFGYQ